MNKKNVRPRLISIFLPSLHGGGVERMRLYLAQRFVERGYKVDILLVEYKGVYLSQVPDSINIVDLNAGRVISSLLTLTRYLRRVQPDVLLSAMDHSNVVAILARRLAGVQTRVVASVHNTLSIDLIHSNLRSRLIPYIARLCYSWADDIIAVSKGVADDLSKTTGFPRNKIHVIYNPVVVPEILELAKLSVTHPWFVAGEPDVLLSVGRLTQQKDYPTLLRAVLLVKKIRPVRLLILGEGKERSKLEVLVQDLGLDDVVNLAGFKKNPYAYMSKATVFVLSSAWEGFGNVLVEAMAVGTPVVSTDCPNGPSEILENGKYGQLVPVGNAEALAEAILRTIDNPTHSGVLRCRAKDFSSDDIANQYLEVLYGSG